MKKDTAQSLLELSESEYNTYASEFSRTRKFFWKELGFLTEYVETGDTVLDMGCGNGRLVDVLEDSGAQYTGVDSSQKLIEIAQGTKGTKNTFIHANALSLPFKDNSFDVVFSIAVLHHIPSKENRMQFVSEAYRVLKPGGVCVVTVWNTLQWRFAKTHTLHTLKKLLGFSKLDFGDMIIPFGKEKRTRYIHSLSKRGLGKLFERNNFTDISIEEVKRKSGYANFVVVARKSE